ncbi:MAG TPA: hypothetical protein VGP68_03555 [Gemmataceae bacterium]|jgi:hypothetical protein|nr:hypothetical protein [Gemmataceae bacterium]
MIGKIDLAQLPQPQGKIHFFLTVTVRETSRNTLGKILAFSAVLEIGTGLCLMLDPALVIILLLGAREPGEGLVLGRFAGVALLALGLACWPNGQGARSNSSAVRGMFTYNGLIAFYLAYLGAVEHLVGPLLWPAVALHAVVTLLLAWMSFPRRG